MEQRHDQIVYLSARDIEAAGADMTMALEVIEQVLVLHARGQVNLPSKVVLDLDERRHGRINAMPAHVGGDVDMCGIKWIAGFPNNPVRHGLPRASALIVLNDPRTGLPLAIMDGTLISALRTGAVTGVGARYLVRREAHRLGLIGAGVQGWRQLEALQLVLPAIAEVRIFDARRKAADRFAARAAGRYVDLTVTVADDAERAVRGADVLVTATTADEPIVKADWLEPGVFFAHVGSYQEEEPAVIVRADMVVVDDWQEVLHRRTPLLARMHAAGDIDDARIHANIGQIIVGDKPGRGNEEQRIFFSPLGLGSEDVALAAHLYRNALDRNLGIQLAFGPSASG